MSVEKFIQFTNFEVGFILFKDLGSLPYNLYNHTLNRNDISNDHDFLKKSKIIAVDFRDIFMDIHKYINEKYKDKISIVHMDYYDKYRIGLKVNKIINVTDKTTKQETSKINEDFDIQIDLIKLYYYYIKCLVNDHTDKDCDYYDYNKVEFQYILKYTVKHKDPTKSTSRLFRNTKDVSDKPCFHRLLNTNYVTTFIESFKQDLTEIITEIIMQNVDLN